MANTEQIQTSKPAPIVWAHLVEPRPARKINNAPVKPRYEVTFLFPADHPDLPRITGEIARLANPLKEKLGNPNLKLPVRRGDKEADEAKTKGRDREWMRGHVLLNAHAGVERLDGRALTPPRLKAIVNRKFENFSDDDMRLLARKYFYSGVLAIGTFSFASYEGMGGGVSCYINEILSLNVGDKINTGVDDEERYGESVSEYLGKVSAIDPTAGAEELVF